MFKVNFSEIYLYLVCYFIELKIKNEKVLQISIVAPTTNITF